MRRFRIKRKNEKWVSNNRVLLGSSKKDPGRNPNFDTEETKLLISLWGDPIVQRTLITTHRKHTVIAQLAKQMNEYGYNRSTEEINTRIKNLKCFYNRLKRDMEMGSISGITWKHFGAMDEIMTRSIFSVRPNEIPKPSLKYQLEQELEEKREKNKAEDAMNGNDSSNTPILEENLSCSSMSSKEENDGHINSEESMEYIEKYFCKAKKDDSLKVCKTEIEEVPLLIPKDEPVEDDEQIITDEITRRKRERWVSKSKELHGASINDPGRNPNFDYDETKSLISLWGDPFFQKTLITTHRKQKVIVQLAEKMKEYGYNRTPGEINTRIKNLKCFYNRLKRDLDAGVVEEISWKHFKSMDEIMNRSVFSASPNEIPKPSRRYQIEMANIETEEKKKQKTTNLQEISLKNEVLSEDNEVQTINSDSSSDIHDSEGVIKDDNAEVIHLNNNKLQGKRLLMSKDEPINQKEKNPDTQVPILSEYIQVANSSSSPGSQILNSIKTVHTIPNKLKTSKASTTVPQSIVFTNPPANGISSQGKISLVPTNFLLQQNNKPQPQQIQIRPQTQQRIICAQPNNQTNTGIVSSAGNGRMKVLFVNAFQNGNTSNVSANKEFPLNNPNIISSSNIHQTEPTTPISYMDHTRPPRAEDAETNKDYGFELLFNKLIEMQNENNEIQRQQLELDRQRLEFEKSMADKFLEALISLKPPNSLESTNISNTRKRSANSVELNNEKSAVPDIPDELNNYHLLTPKLEKID